MNLTIDLGTVPDFVNLTDFSLTKSEVNCRYTYLSRNVSLEQAKGDFVFQSSIDLKNYDSFKM